MATVKAWLCRESVQANDYVIFILGGSDRPVKESGRWVTFDDDPECHLSISARLGKKLFDLRLRPGEGPVPILIEIHQKEMTDGIS